MPSLGVLQVAIAAKGQSMRLAVAPAANVAFWGSEGSAVEVPVPGGGARFLIRLNSLTGQVARLLDFRAHFFSLNSI
jgi:hypothetical protein